MSDTLHSFLDNKARKRLLEWEDAKFRFWKEYSLDERKVDRMSFIEEWNTLRKKNEEYLRKLLQEQREKDEKKEQEKNNKGGSSTDVKVDNNTKGGTSSKANNDMYMDFDDDAMNLISKVEDKLDQIK